MLISQGSARNERVNLKLACSLALIAGALNAAAFYAVGFFSANMTGNVSALSDHLATGQWGLGLFFLAIVAIFILGAATSTLLINAGRRRGIAAIYAYSILVEAVLLFLLGVVDISLITTWQAPVLTLGLAFLMGFQNAIVTRISDARVRTTHVSGMATDIGIELGIAFDILRGKEPDAHAAENQARLKLHVGTIAAFLVGGTIGVVTYRMIGSYILLACAALLCLIALDGIRRRSGTSASAEKSSRYLGLRKQK